MQTLHNLFDTMDFYGSVLKPLAFRLDPEFVHETALSLIANGAFRDRRYEHPILEQTLFGVHFSNPLGLAAGFDKNAVATERWQDLGFGFAEVGTVTYERQPGNPKPRLFRLPEEEALVNRMGFNNDGAKAISGRIAASRPGIPIGMNLGKSRSAELKDAPKEYQKSFRLLHKTGDYFVVNVSSPNTPGLRSLQEKGPLIDIIASLREVDVSRPLFVKVSPDLSTSALDDVIEVAHQTDLTGLIATNTTTRRDLLRQDPNLEGGLSGRPLREPALHMLSYLARACDPKIVLIGGGGIMSGADLYDRIAAGAHLCQLYTGWVYGGPSSVPRMLRELAELMAKNGMASLQELRGT